MNCNNLQKKIILLKTFSILFGGNNHENKTFLVFEIFLVLGLSQNHLVGIDEGLWKGEELQQFIEK